MDIVRLFQVRNLIMQDITEMMEADPSHERTVCINYDELYEMITDRLSALETTNTAEYRMNLINIADLKDPEDSQGRTYREVNQSRKHKYSVGQLVELDNGGRLFVAKLTRDCDMTPLYSLALNLDRDDEIELMKWHHGYAEEDLTLISGVENGDI